MKAFFQQYRHWILISLLFHCIALFFSVGHLHPDEHYQILEFLGYKLGTTPESALPWEYQAKMRPWTQVFFYYYLTAPLRAMGLTNPFTYTFFLRLVSVVIGFLSSLYLAKYFYQRNPQRNLEKIAIFSSLLLWPLPFLHARLSSEALGTSIFVFALIHFLNFENKQKRIALLIGILFGLSFLLRYHIGFLIFGMCLWALINKQKSIPQLFIMTASTLAVIGLSVFIDYWGYGDWTFAPYEYFSQNIISNKASNYGVSPWWYYFSASLKKLIHPIGIFVILSFLISWIRKPNSWFTFSTLFFFIIHSIIGHKEWRFLFPLIPFIPFAIANLIDLIPLKEKVFKVIYRIFIFLNVILLFSAFKPVDSRYNFLKSNYHIPAIEKLYYNSSRTPYDMAGLTPHFYLKFVPKLEQIKDQQLENFAKKGGFFFTERGKFKTLLNNIETCKILYSDEPFFTSWLSERRYNKFKMNILWKCE
ncbi:MAG: hypothetical protein GY909_15030 [Oligoflexia bacterium]|nr:hypothetical protein [Oligoflexia bacterium]